MEVSESQWDEAFEAICMQIEEGFSLREIFRMEGQPMCRQTFYKLMNEKQSRVDRYARATEIRAALIFDEMLEIADDGTNDYMTITKGDMQYNVEDREVTSRSKLRIDARKWILSKMNPKKYGERVDLQHSGFDGGVIKTENTHKVIFEDYSGDNGNDQVQ